MPVSSPLQDPALRRRQRRGLILVLAVLWCLLPGARLWPMMAQTLSPPLDSRVALDVVTLDGSQPARGQRRDLLETPTMPGSVIKVFTLAAALEQQVITPATGAVCRRQVTVDGVRYTCAHPDLKRAMTPAEALAHSCNDFFVSLARRLRRADVNRIRVAAGLPPLAATTPLAAALVGLDGPRVTPRHLAQALARLVAVGRQASVPMRDDTRAVLRAGLSGAATYGTAAAFAEQRVPAWAKTGTAPMPGGGIAGLVVALWPAPAPTHSLVALAPGGAGIDVAAVAATWLAANTRTGAQVNTTGRQPPQAPQAPGSEAPKGEGRSTGPTIAVGRTLPDGRVRIESLAMDDYVAQVLAGEGQPRAARGAQEALAITARTFAEANRGRHRAEGFDVCDTTHCQVVRPSTSVTRDAARATSGQVLLDRGRAAQVFYSASCGGMPERASHVWPGAPDHEHPHRDEAHAGEVPWSSEVRAADIERALRATGRKGRLRDLTIVGRNATGRVARLRAEGLVPADITGNDFRLAVGRIAGWQSLKSTAFEIRRAGTTFRFVGRGFGHGVGLCVVGAGNRAQAGASASDILAFYFPSLTIGALAGKTPTPVTSGAPAASSAEPPAPSATPRARLPAPSADASTDVRLSLPIEQEGERAELLALVRKARNDIAATAGVTAPPVLTVTVHPSVDAFGRATGQPWWVGAATRGQDIALLPPRLLRQRGDLARTIRHEVAHALLDGQLAGRPLWVHEGLAIHFSRADLPRAGSSGPAPSMSGAQTAPLGPSTRGARPSCPTDDELRRPVSAGAQRDAYARAEQCVNAALARGVTWQAIK